ncbi:hypothetical protein DRE_04422 [Drechslerella stenobrocha 248]|uniref:Condensation domain-containing protein n=1 Tax=Drechslerella stenobrocha 248 TaxID=1043628 RepID=W7HQ23_9PEZI|nr:hypothetical protein DRE_04422 [Drechslerella stenobrocha 248]
MPSAAGATKLHWAESAPGLWKREFGPMERILHLATVASPGTKQWAVSTGAILPTDAYQSLDIETIKTAWLALRDNHPILGCIITDIGFEYQVPANATELQKWVDETVRVDMSGKTGREIAPTAPAPETAELYFLPNNNELFIHIRHELIDGIGSMVLLNNFLKLLRSGLQAEPNFGDEVARLTPSLDEVMKAEDPASDVIEQAHAILQDYSVDQQIRLNVEPRDPSESRLYEYQFNEADTAVLLKACKTNNITITTALTAASSKAVLENSGQSSGDLRSPFCVSMRDALPAPYNGSEYAAAAYFTFAFPKIPVSKSRSSLKVAKETKEFFHSWKNNKNNVAFGGPMLEKYGDSLVAAVVNGIPPSFLLVSSWGIADKYITEPIEDFWGGCCAGTPTAGMLIYTAKNRIRLMFCYSSTFYSEKSVRDLAEGTAFYLRDCLQVNSPVSAHNNSSFLANMPF